MVQKPPSEPTIESMDGEFKVITATMRGTTYVLRELPADAYEKCIKQATNEKGNIQTDELFKLMLGKVLVEPKGMTVAEAMKKPYPVVRKLNDIVDQLHYTSEVTEEETAEEEAEGEAKG